jgi:K+-sensing histidine kinase KdpD
MDTFFARADRADGDDLELQIEIAANNPVADGLMQNISGMLAVLNANRQIVSINKTFLKSLGIDDPGRVLGLRPGEALHCEHATDEPHGCGTTRHCASCGAAIAIVCSLGVKQSIERTCALTRVQNGTSADLALSIRSTPIRIQGQDFLLLFVKDISHEQRRANLERSFFHDMSNVLTVLSGACEILNGGGGDQEVVRQITRSTSRLVREFEIQKRLFLGDEFDFPVRASQTTVSLIFGELREQFARHPAAHNRSIEFPAHYPPTLIVTDHSLCMRVLTNMIVNALEATKEKDVVQIWLEESPNAITFCVWNGQVIDKDNALRIFQRNFSTKEGLGRGFGTYSMKLFGEEFLSGKVSFQSPERSGTVFRLELPLDRTATESSA